MHRRQSSQRGFTLIELMIVVVIVGILAALAIPRFWQATIRTRQSEAKLILKQICTNQMVYKQSNPANQYYQPAGAASAASPNAFAALDVQIPDNALYTYTIAVAGNDFTATATADLDGDGFNDVWTMQSAGVINNTQDDATN